MMAIDYSEGIDQEEEFGKWPSKLRSVLTLWSITMVTTALSVYGCTAGRHHGGSLL